MGKLTLFGLALLGSKWIGLDWIGKLYGKAEGIMVNVSPREVPRSKTWGVPQAQSDFGWGTSQMNIFPINLHTTVSKIFSITDIATLRQNHLKCITR